MHIGSVAGALCLAGVLVALGYGLAVDAQTTMPSARRLAALKAEYKRPTPSSIENKSLVTLGKHLFWDKRASASGATACGSCHFTHLAWATKDARSRNDSGKLTSRRSQTLLAIGYAPNGLFGWDGRNASLEAQAKSSILTGSMSMRETETPVKGEVIEQRIAAIPEYHAMFQAALPGEQITVDAMAKAIAAYERTIEPGIAPFDRWVEGDENAISPAAQRGFVIFNDRGECFLCHSGWRFTNDSFHDIGTTTTDKGRGREMKEDVLMQYAFKTPTLRSVALRPPYMHNGSAKDLYETVKHYEKGGVDRPSRSPLIKALSFTEEERQDLVAFMESLTGAGEGQEPPPPPGK